MKQILRATEIQKSFLFKGEVSRILKGVQLNLSEGEFVSIIGASGCGKTTLLELLAGITLPDSGHIFYQDEEITGKTGILGYMPQKDLLFPWLKVKENILLPSRIKGLKLKEEKERVKELLPIFGLERYADYLPWQLSGGLRQRVALARTYMTGSKVWLLDEPLANLDAITRSGLQDWLLKIVKSLGLSVILVTHDIDEALYLSDRIEIMRSGLFLDSICIDRAMDESSKAHLKDEIRAQLLAE